MPHMITDKKEEKEEEEKKNSESYGSEKEAQRNQI